MKKILFNSFFVLLATMGFADTLTYHCENQVQGAKMTMMASYPDHHPISFTFEHQDRVYHGEGNSFSVEMDEYDISLTMPVDGGVLTAQFPMTEMYHDELRPKDRFCDGFPTSDRFGMPQVIPSFCSMRSTIAYINMVPNHEDPDAPVMDMDGFFCTLTRE